MNTLLAKPARLEVLRECMAEGCSCFTDKGYYIRYHGSNVDSMLFVCEDCYNRSYRHRCAPGDFDEQSYQRTARTPRYQRVSPGLRLLLRFSRRGIRLTRAACILLAAVLICAFYLKEQPGLRTQLPSPRFHLEVNPPARGTQAITRQFQNITDQITKVFHSDGGDTLD